MEVLSNIDFKYEEDLTNKVMDIITRHPNGDFDVVGKIRWLEAERVTLCGPNKVNRPVPTAILADDTASIKISIWGALIKDVVENETLRLTSVKCEDFFGLRLATLAATIITKIDTDLDVDWKKHNVEPLKILLCCPVVESAKLHSFLQCFNADCRKIVNPVCR